MAQFNTLVGSILQDMIRAQHEANLYSLGLKNQYGQDAQLRVPGAVLTQMEIELKYAFHKTDVKRTERQTDLKALKKYLGELAEQLAKIAITNVTSTASNAEDQEPEPEALNLLFEQEAELNRGFGAFLARKIGETLAKNAAQMTGDNGTIDKEAIMQSVMGVVENHLLDNHDLATLFAGDLRQRAQTNLAQTLRILIEKRTKDYNFMRTETFNSAEIIVTADELKKLPAGAIHTMRVSLAPQSLQADEPITANQTEQ